MTTYESRNKSSSSDNSRIRPRTRPHIQPHVQAVLNHLDLERTQDNHFVTTHKNEGWYQVFGGQIMAQALMAARRSVPEERNLASYHSAFLNPGRLDSPIEYRVHTLRDSRSFSTRRITAVQDEVSLYEMTASFKKEEAGLEHQVTMPNVAGPDACPRSEETRAIYSKHFPGHLPETDPEADPSTESLQPIFETRLASIETFLKPTGRDESHPMWMRFCAELNLPHEQHKSLLAYASDLGMGHITAQPHGIGGFNHDLRYVSLDHAMWFHRPFRADEWMLLVRDCPSTHSGRGLVRGTFFTESGDLAASFVQDGLFRMRA